MKDLKHSPDEKILNSLASQNRRKSQRKKLKKLLNKKKKRNNRSPKIFEFNGKTLIISGLLLYDSHSWDIRVYHAKN